MTMQSLIQQLKKKILLMDGAMGTILQGRGLPPGVPSVLWTLERPEEVKKVHQAYLDAGAEVIFTNTFTASRNYVTDVETINRTAVRLAREVAGDKAWVAGSVGPLGKKTDDAAKIYREQIEALVSAGVDLIALETMTNRAETEIAVRAAKPYINDKTPLLVSMTVTKSGLLPSGENPLALVSFLEQNGVAIIGLNCSEGPESIYPVFQKLQKQTQLPIAIKPNRGIDRTMADDEFVRWGKRFVDEGANLIGGCCGTTPETIRKLAQIIQKM
ncbi:MAG: homocysteine S-methyltransferase family protein [Deltaproteobacteria bacterium]|nr:homocysteine S-methyltransferase family protein [Deltaproteobacteria bacterium]